MEGKTMKKPDIQKIKSAIKTHAPVAAASAVAGGVVTFVSAKAYFVPSNINTLFLTQASRKLLLEGHAIGFDLKDATLALVRVTT